MEGPSSFEAIHAQEAFAGPEPIEVDAPAGALFGVVSARGTACNSSDTKALVRADRKTATLYFDRFEVEMSERDARVDADCIIEYDIDAPAGYTYTVSQLYYNLLGEVREGVDATLAVQYGFDDAEPWAEAIESLPPNRLDEPIRPHAVRHAVTAREWAPCASVPRKLKVKVALALVNPEPATYSKLTLIQIDTRNEREGSGAVELELAWARCSAP